MKTGSRWLHMLHPKEQQQQPAHPEEAGGVPIPGCGSSSPNIHPLPISPNNLCRCSTAVTPKAWLVVVAPPRDGRRLGHDVEEEARWLSSSPGPPAACAIGRWVGVGWPACRSSDAAPCRWSCSPAWRGQWALTCRCGRSPRTWWSASLSVRQGCTDTVLLPVFCEIWYEIWHCTCIHVTATDVWDLTLHMYGSVTATDVWDLTLHMYGSVTATDVWDLTCVWQCYCYWCLRPDIAHVYMLLLLMSQTWHCTCIYVTATDVSDLTLHMYTCYCYWCLRPDIAHVWQCRYGYWCLIKSWFCLLNESCKSNKQMIKKATKQNKTKKLGFVSETN